MLEDTPGGRVPAAGVIESVEGSPRLVLEGVTLQTPNFERTLVSVGHRATILQYHTQVLELTGEGQWLAQPAAGYRFKQ